MASSNQEFERRKKTIQDKVGYICDMDGVIYHGNKLLPGVKKFLHWCHVNNKKFLFLTNNSKPTPRELQEKLKRLGLQLPEEVFWTSALSTANFIASQKEKSSVYVIGEAGLFNALYNVGISMNDVDPDYVIIGESISHNTEKISKAVQLVSRGAKLIATNPDVSGPTEAGIEPACGAWASVVEKATGQQCYFLGKPNPLMMRQALNKLGLRAREIAIIGDRMDTDIIAGIESQIDSVLVLSGVSSEKDIFNFSYRPFLVLNGVGDIPEESYIDPPDDFALFSKL